MSDWYILDDNNNPVHEPDFIKAGKWMEQNRDRKVVKQEEVSPGVRVSTVFLGLDHSWKEGPPLIFETMIFGGPHDYYQDRCSTWEEAEGMHKRAVKLAKESDE